MNKHQLSVAVLTVGFAVLDCQSAPVVKPTFQVDFSSTNEIAAIYNYRDRTPTSVKMTDRGPVLVFTGVKNVAPGEEWGKDTQWGLSTRMFDVKPAAEYCVVLRMAGDLPAGYGKVVSEVQWFGESGKPLQTVDQLGRDVPLSSPIEFPTAVRGSKLERVVYTRGVVPAAAVRGTIVLKVDMPDLKPGEKVDVCECAYYEHQKGSSWQFDDVEAPSLELLNDGSLKCDTEPLRFRLKDASGVDMKTFGCSINGTAVALADLKREGDVFVYEPKTPWAKNSVQTIEVEVADVNGIRDRDCVFAVFAEGKPAHRFCSIRDDGVMLVDGKPFFPFGLFGVRLHDGNNHDLDGCIREMSENGLNVAQTYMVRGRDGVKQDAVYDALVEACGKYGVLFYAEPALRSLEPHERFRRMAENIFRGRQFKEILGWGVGDDTSVNTSPAELKRLHRFCKAIDPGALTISADIVKSPSSLAAYIPNADVLLLESYPIRAEKPQPDEMAKSAEALDDARTAVEISGVKGTSVMAIPQSFKGWSSWKRYPTKEEIRLQAYIAICCGARGLIYYTSCGFNGNEGPLNDPVHKREFYEFSREIAALIPSLVTRDAAVQPKVSVVKGKAKNVLGGDAVRTLLKEDGLLLVANTSQLPVTAEITLPDGRRLVRELSSYGAFAEKTK